MMERELQKKLQKEFFSLGIDVIIWKSYMIKKRQQNI